jgi:hypothetical protein
MSEQAKPAPPEQQRLLIHYDTAHPLRMAAAAKSIIAWAVGAVVRIIDRPCS